MQVQKNWTRSRVPRPERLSWDKLYRHFLAFLIMESMWQFHFKSLKTLRPSILGLATNSIGMPLTTTRWKDVVFLVLKFMHSSLHFVSFRWNLSAEAWLARVSTAAWMWLSWFLLIVSEMVVSLTYFQWSVAGQHRARWSWWWKVMAPILCLAEPPPGQHPILRCSHGKV